MIKRRVKKGARLTAVPLNRQNSESVLEMLNTITQRTNDGDVIELVCVMQVRGTTEPEICYTSTQNPIAIISKLHRIIHVMQRRLDAIDEVEV